jgi:hypothetical protein
VCLVLGIYGRDGLVASVSIAVKIQANDGFQPIHHLLQYAHASGARLKGRERREGGAGERERGESREGGGGGERERGGGGGGGGRDQEGENQKVVKERNEK